MLRYAAFTDDPSGGNPAGIVLDAADASAAEMLAVAAQVGYAETAFVVSPLHERRVGLRYFSPHAEVPFCGHATVATAVLLGERHGAGTFTFDTPVGAVELTTADGRASFTSVDPLVTELPAADVDELLDLLGLRHDDLDELHPPRLAAAGNPHPVLVVRDRARFDGFTVDPLAARRVLDAHGWPATITVVHRREPLVFEARNVFPVGTITEDPATGSAAAAFGGYLRALGLVEVPARVTIHQGRHVGRPGLLIVDVPAEGGIVVTGSAVPIG
ncbi:PhzF family phenazine biosynthesis protein [Kineococcus rhizosphaerae]|uniref:PhzF family phenazine biosynthesis protein n=1 Tax=Kineococcus rhizosphaerae TaxID=559628 RepID=A0A2T0R6P2_9ACTN|nr:PhzF family phenazine biosynthesis protein [Kineococcus rhizosphaerae]